MQRCCHVSASSFQRGSGTAGSDAAGGGSPLLWHARRRAWRGAAGTDRRAAGSAGRRGVSL
ncbi:hypothetical protein PT2222_10010 [Paraburkholderia tropica]